MCRAVKYRHFFSENNTAEDKNNFYDQNIQNKINLMEFFLICIMC